MQTKRTFWTILFIGFLDNLSVGILLPLVPLLLTKSSSPISILPAGLTDTQGYIIFGWLMAVYTIAQFISTPVLGQLSDHYGRRPLLAASLAGTSLAYLLFGIGVVTHNLPLLFVARILDGITGGNVSVAQAVVADITEQKDRAKMYGLFGSSLGLGFAVGPVIGAFFSNPKILPWFNAATPFWVTAGLAALSVIVVTLFLKESLVKPDELIKLRIPLPLTATVKAFRQPTLRKLFTGIFTWRLGFGFWTTFGAVYLIYRFNLTQDQMGIYFLVVGLTLILSQIFLVRWVAKFFSEEKLVFYSILLVGITFMFILLPKNWLHLFWFVPFLAGFNSLTFANIPAVVSKSAEPTTQGTFSGINNSIQSLALSFAPILSGYISAAFNPSVVVVMVSVLMVLSAIILYGYKAEATKL